VVAGFAAGFGVGVWAAIGMVADAARRSRADVSFMMLIIVHGWRGGSLEVEFEKLRRAVPSP
jgi:hypothetical protein